MSKKFFMILSLAVIFLIPQMALSAETIKIGAIFSVTGPASFLGDPEKKSATMVADQINAAGGINGKKIELIVLDDEGNETKAVTAANRLIEKDKVVAILGPSLTGTSLAVKKVCEDKKVPLISCAAATEIVLPVSPYIFKLPPSDAFAAEVCLDYLKSKKIKSYAILNDSNAFGSAGKNKLVELAKAKGFTVTAVESYATKDADMTSQLTKIKATNPGAIIVWGTNPGPAVIAKNVKQLGIKIPVLNSHGIATPKFIEIAGKDAEGIILPGGKLLVPEQLPAKDRTLSVVKKYSTEYNAKYNQPISTFGAFGYDGLHLLAQVINKAGTDRKAIRNGLEAVKNFHGVTGTYNFSPKDHNGLTLSCFAQLMIESGRFKVLKLY